MSESTCCHSDFLCDYLWIPLLAYTTVYGPGASHVHLLSHLVSCVHKSENVSHLVEMNILLHPVPDNTDLKKPEKIQTEFQYGTFR